MSSLKPFQLDAFPGFLCVFLLDMGLIAGRGLRNGWRSLSPAVAGFAWVMPLIGATFAALFATAFAEPSARV